MGTMPKGLPLAALLLIAGFLSGCATAAQRQYQAMAANNQSAIQKLGACTSAVYNAPDSAPLRKHVPYNINTASLEQLSDTNLATDEEVKSVLANHPKIQACTTDYLNQIALSTPSLVPIYAAFLTRRDNALIELIQKKLSWGDYVKQVRDAWVDAQSRVSAESQRIIAGLNRSNEAELARRQAASNALLQYSETQHAIDALSRPVITNCNRFGSTVNCVSQ